MQPIRIREFAESDWPQVWPIVRDVVRAADTFVYDPAMTEAEARAVWIEAPPGQTPGSHVSTASFMVAAAARGRGVGTALCRFALEWAQQRGCAGMQFNAVAHSNRSAIALYERLGFKIVGTVPGAFAHPTLGQVGLHIMYRAF